VKHLDDLITRLPETYSQSGSRRLVVQEAEQEVLGSDVPVPEPGRLTASPFQDLVEADARPLGD
jgi:hypothetical protein